MVEKRARIVKLESLARQEVFIVVGLLMIIGTSLKLFFGHEFSSDWFWFLAGIGLVLEGAIALSKQRRFDRKYKVIEKPVEE